MNICPLLIRDYWNSSIVVRFRRIKLKKVLIAFIEREKAARFLKICQEL